MRLTETVESAESAMSAGPHAALTAHKTSSPGAPATQLEWICSNSFFLSLSLFTNSPPTPQQQVDWCQTEPEPADACGLSARVIARPAHFDGLSTRGESAAVSIIFFSKPSFGRLSTRKSRHKSKIYFNIWFSPFLVGQKRRPSMAQQQLRSKCSPTW